MADGRRMPIEMLAPGDIVRSLTVPGLKTDVPFRAQYEWLSTWGLEGATVREARVDEVRLGEHDGFYLINARIKATFEHPFLIRRGDRWGFCSAELLKIGDRLIRPDGRSQVEERIDSLERIEGRIRTVAIRVPGTNTYLAEGVWTHNDASSQSVATQGSQSLSASQSSSESSSRSDKTTGSSFSTSGSIGIGSSSSSGSSSSGGTVLSQSGKG